MMNVVIFGGTGHMGAAIGRHLDPSKYRITIVTRSSKKSGQISWDGKTLGRWTEALEGADVVINLAGRRVHCRYNEANLQEMLDSRIESTALIGKAITACKSPPKVWLQASTATIYAHRFDAPNDEATGIMGGTEPGVPAVWNFSIKIAKNWERAFFEANTPQTRKVALRSAIMMGIDKDSAFEIFSRLTKIGLGGALAGGRQYVSWIHELDFVRAIEFLIDHTELDGPVNVSAPNPVPQADFARAMRKAWHVPFGLPAAEWMIAIGAWALNGDTELVMKSRRVVPTRLLEHGFEFQFPTWPEAAKDLVARMRSSV
jgi:uncharacterized protein (TIGR01777 family)